MAKAKYETAKEEGYRASLLEQTRPNVFQMSVANIMPNDTISVTINYTEFLKSEGGIYQFVLPTTIGRRYSGENQFSQSAPVNTEYLASKSSKHPFDVNLTLSTSVPIQMVNSPSHRIDVSMPNTQYNLINLNPTERHAANRDFIFEYAVRGDLLSSGVMTHQSMDENFFLLEIHPPEQVELNDVPPREYLFVIDVSGSMNGYPLNTAKALLEELLNDLRPQDLFNIFEFEFGSSSLFRESVPASEDNIRKALRFTRTRSSMGGTNLNSAMNKIYKSIDDDRVSRSMVIITDGQIEAEKKVFRTIRENLHKSNVFAFGIGESVNRYLIEGLAHAGMGREFIVTNQNLAEKEASKLAAYINRPSLTNIHLDFGDNQVYDVIPSSYPDVLSDRPLVVFGKFQGELNAPITVFGNTGKNDYVESITTLFTNENQQALSYLWARNKLKELSDFNDVTPSIHQEIKELGLKYSLLTEFTSFVAIDNEQVNKYQNTVTINQPLPTPVDKTMITSTYHGNTGYRSRSNATGAVSRAVSSYGIDLLLPNQCDVTGPLLNLRWAKQSDDQINEYTITVHDIFDQEIFRTSTTKTSYLLDLEQIEYHINLFVIQVESGELRSKKIGAKVEINTEFKHLYDTSIAFPFDKYQSASIELMNRGLIADALTILEIAIRKYPEIQELQDLYSQIIINGLTH
jgi:Ca-activated chloride channel family protein